LMTVAISLSPFVVKSVKPHTPKNSLCIEQFGRLKRALALLPGNCQEVS
jgi:hypothetical protein